MQREERGRGGGGGEKEGRHLIAQQCGRQKEREVESERERDYCLLESSNLELCHEYQRLYSPTVNASLSLCSPIENAAELQLPKLYTDNSLTLRLKTTQQQLSTPSVHNYSYQKRTLKDSASKDTFSVDFLKMSVQQLKK